MLYSADRGIYEDSPKTATSNRYITLPVETMKLLRKYWAWQNEEQLRMGELLPIPELCVRPGQRQAHAHGQRDHMAGQIQ